MQSSRGELMGRDLSLGVQTGVQYVLDIPSSLYPCGFQAIIGAVSHRPIEKTKASKEKFLEAFFIGKSVIYAATAYKALH